MGREIESAPIDLRTGSQAEWAKSSKPREEDAPGASGRFRMHEDSQGVRWIEEVREVERGSERERELAHRLQQLEDVGKGLEAVGELAAAVKKIAGGGKWLGSLIALAMLASPVVDRLLSPNDDIVEALDSIEAGLEDGRQQRTALAVWLWEIEQCRQGKRPCPDQPPASVRLMLAEDAKRREGP